MSEGGRLKLRAEDERDLEVLGAMVQDALVPLADMAWLQDQNRFVMVVNRFMWDRAGETIAGEEDATAATVYFRVHGLLSVHNVRSVQVRGVDQRERERMLNLLAVTGGRDHVQLEFASGGTIRIEVDRLLCLLEDLGEPWPTRWRPGHGTEQDEGGQPPPEPSE